MSNSSAEQLLAAAEKRANSSGGWFSSKATAQEEAVEMFKAAANKFRIANRFNEAGDAFMRAGQVEEKSQDKDFAANTFFEASKCYKMGSPEKAVSALSASREILLGSGRFRQAADREKQLAELYKGDARDPQRAIESYEKAAEWYSQEGAGATASGCYRESATLAVEIGDFKKALERWEQVAAMSLESNLTRYNVKDYYLSAGCCYLAIPDYVACSNAMGFYAQQDPSFPTTMEGRFLHSLLESCEQGDIEGFDARVMDYDRTKKIVGHMATLVRAKGYAG
ncbi:vesicular-fusion protein sec17 [Ceraceosorus bombacis]|uniref:Vesicular-fusion protein sec17 n=1 Tax=Ceraceosorus bombacis TaxID=401625 RepID=A0A0N7L9C2_9BASI|nr:vesicular-fusion protein sec17 [Ceraceosorus bombacis]